MALRKVVIEVVVPESISAMQVLNAVRVGVGESCEDDFEVLSARIVSDLKFCQSHPHKA